MDLQGLESCSIKKEYQSIEAGELKSKKLHHFLKRIILKLVFKNGNDTVSLPLYDAQKEQSGNIEQLEIQAKKWENIVSELLPVTKAERA